MSALDGIRRLRGVSWRWREGVPGKRAGAQEAGVIAQDVREAFPHLASEDSRGYLMVDYAGLARELGRAVGELAERVDELDAMHPSRISDEGLKEDLDPLAGALERLRRGDTLEGEDFTALVGLLVEAVKELDERVSALEARS